jgi:hypothetical protein
MKPPARVCAYCKYWRPHVVYDYIGYCDKHNKLTFEDDTCLYFEPLEIKDEEFYWCSSCKTRITGEEAKEYLKKGHRIHRGAYVEPDIRDELYSVF